MLAEGPLGAEMSTDETASLCIKRRVADAAFSMSSAALLNLRPLGLFCIQLNRINYFKKAR